MTYATDLCGTCAAAITYAAEIPPFTLITWPVILPDFSLAKNAFSDATSSALGNPKLAAEVAFSKSFALNPPEV